MPLHEFVALRVRIAIAMKPPSSAISRTIAMKPKNVMPVLS